MYKVNGSVYFLCVIIVQRELYHVIQINIDRIPVEKDKR